MSKLTNSATTKDWVAVIQAQGITISAFTDYKVNRTELFTREVFEDALRRVSRPDKQQLGKEKPKTSG